MKERPILFSTELVRAINDDRKTQTRRVMKRQPSLYDVHGWHETGALCGHGWQATTDAGPWPGPMESIKCPYGKPGDRLWVRERLYFDPDAGWKYWADEALVTADYAKKTPRPCPSIHMPRLAARTLLEIKKVRIERLQDITEGQAIAEGLEWVGDDCGFWKAAAGEGGWDDPIEAFRDLWDSINAEPKPCYGRAATALSSPRRRTITHYVSYPWDDVRETRIHRGKPWHVHGNPWVWAVHFRRIAK